MKKVVVTVLLSVGISACTPSSGNADKQYLMSMNGPSVVAPTPLTNTNISRFYELPNPKKNAMVSIAPQPPSPANSQTT